MATLPQVVLASESPYRRQLLARLLPGFVCAAQHVDETAEPGELPPALAARLAALKAGTARAAYPAAVIIGSDQVADLDGERLGKPGSVSAAVSQLLRCAGRTVQFHTAVCVVAPGVQPAVSHLDLTRVRFRSFDRTTAQRYVAADLPLDCAGSFKAEGRGVALLESIDNRDPTAIQGLPLIWLAATLRSLGITLF